ncbi:hypothetical protein NKJ50_32930 [Mesorhizobium sp. M0115]|uniref:hypothetical protein n=1 Tax=Mesorhizobium sp. M0115 TaxID=2956883 RepID=UPI003339D105
MLTGDSIIQGRLLTNAEQEVKPLLDIIRQADAAFTNLEAQTTIEEIPPWRTADPILARRRGFSGSWSKQVSIYLQRQQIIITAYQDYSMS